MVKITRPDNHEKTALAAAEENSQTGKVDTDQVESETASTMDPTQEQREQTESNRSGVEIGNKHSFRDDSTDDENERPEKIGLFKGLFKKKEKPVVEKPKRDIGQTIKYGIIGLIGLSLIGWIMVPSEEDKVKQAEVAERKQQRAAAKEKEYQDALAEQEAKERELEEIAAAREEARLEREQEAERLAIEREKAKVIRAEEIAQLKREQECRQLTAAAEREAAKVAAKEEIAAKAAARANVEDQDLGPTQEELALLTREERVVAIKAEKERRTAVRAERRASAIAEQERRKTERTEREDALQSDANCDHLRINASAPAAADSTDSAGQDVMQPVDEE